MRTQNPTCYRLVHCQNDGINDIEETVVRVQGILVSKDLPPAIWNGCVHHTNVVAFLYFKRFDTVY